MINVDRLYSESIEKIQKLKEIEIKKSLEFRNVEHNLMSEQSKIMILTQLVTNYEASLLSLFNAKNSVFINFEQFSQILFDINFTLFHRKEISDKIMLINTKNDELKLINDAWKFLNGGDQSIETLDSNKVVAFSAAVLGLYKAGPNKEEKDEIKVKLYNNNLKGDPKIIHPNKQLGNNIFNDEKILYKVMPNIDWEQYRYSKDVKEHLKIYFRYFCERRIDHLMKKKNIYYSSKINSDFVNKDLVFKPHLSQVTQSVAENYRKKCIQKVETDSNKQYSTIRKIKLEEAYVYQSKKKDQ